MSGGETQTSRKIAVLGAGISGLSVAYGLAARGLDVTVFEKSSHVGGTIITEKHEGFLVELGPNSALETSEVLKQLIRDAGIEGDKIYGSEKSKNRYVVRNGELHALPMSPARLLRTKLFSSRAKLRLIKEPFIKPTPGGDISLADFVRYRLGQEFLDYAVNPFVAGVFAGDPEMLSAPAAFPKLVALEQKYGSLIKGALKGARERKKSKDVSKDRAKLFSFRDGLETFPRALASKLEGKIVLNAQACKIRKNREDGSFTIDLRINGNQERRSFDSVVVSVPAASIASLLEDLSPGPARRIGEIYYPPVAMVFFGLRSGDVVRELDGFGFLIPKREGRGILGTIWSSSLFPNRAPEGHVALTTFVGGARNPENAALDDDQLEKIVYTDLNDLLGLRGKPVFTRIKRWPTAIPQYTMGYKEYQDYFDAIEAEHAGLYFAGNYRSGISISDSVVCADVTVQKMTQPPRSQPDRQRAGGR